MKTENKRRAMEALLDQNNGTLGQVAEAAGISRRTLWGYLSKDIQFAEEFNRRRQLVAVERAEVLAAQRDAAISAIVDMMGDDSQPAAVRLRAATTLLSAAADAEVYADAVAKANLLTATWH